MSTFFVGGLMVIGLVFLAKKARDFETKIKQERRIHEIEQELQQLKDKVFQQFWW